MEYHWSAKKGRFLDHKSGKEGRVEELSVSDQEWNSQMFATLGNLRTDVYAQQKLGEMPLVANVHPQTAQRLLGEPGSSSAFAKLDDKDRRHFAGSGKPVGKITFGIPLIVAVTPEVSPDCIRLMDAKQGEVGRLRIHDLP